MSYMDPKFTLRVAWLVEYWSSRISARELTEAIATASWCEPFIKALHISHNTGSTATCFVETPDYVFTEG